MRYKVDDIIDGRYKVLGLLGQGGHGMVYRAEDLQLEAPVAIKTLHNDIASEPGFKTRMQREARAMGTLSGTSAVQIYAFNKAEDGVMYIVRSSSRGATWSSTSDRSRPTAACSRSPRCSS